MVKKRVVLVAMLAALALSVPPAAHSVGAGVTHWQFQQVKFQSQTRSSMIYVHMLRFEVRAASYEAPAGAGAHAHEPMVFVFGCIAFGKRGVADYACGFQKPSAFTMAPDLSATSITFKGRSTTYRIPVTARFTTAGNSSPTHKPVREAKLPIGEATINAQAGIETTRWGTSTGKATVSGVGTFPVSRLTSWVSSRTWMSADGSL